MSLLLLFGAAGTAPPVASPVVVVGVSYPFSPGYEFFIRHYSRSGGIKNAYIAPRWLRYTNSVAGQEPLIFALEAGHKAAAAIVEYDILEVWLRHRGLGIVAADGGFVRDFVGIMRESTRETDADGLVILGYEAPHERHILSWRSILYWAGINNRSSFTAVPAETIVKNLVKYNTTSLAVTGGTSNRQRNGNLATGMGITVTVATDQGRGNTLTMSFTGDNLLRALQDIAAVGGGDFSFVWQGGVSWLFEFYPGQLGGDKRSGANRVVFDDRTLINPRLRRHKSGGTVALSAGQNQGVNRQISVVNGSDYAANRDIELFVDARNEATADGRIYRANVRLDEVKARNELDFRVRQTQDVFYSPVAVTGRKTYRQGDLVKAVYGAEFDFKITAVMVDWRDRGNDDPCQIEIEVEEWMT